MCVETSYMEFSIHDHDESSLRHSLQSKVTVSLIVRGGNLILSVNHNNVFLMCIGIRAVDN